MPRFMRITMLRLAAVVLLLLSACGESESKAGGGGEYKNPEDCAVGKQVSDRKNRTGTIAAVNGTMCKVVFADGTSDHFLFWMLRDAGTSQQTSDELVEGTYNCYSGGNYLFMDVVITSDSRYKDKNGKKGRYSLEDDGTIEFKSGPLEEASGKLLAGPRIGLNMDGGDFYNVSCSLKR